MPKEFNTSNGKKRGAFFEQESFRNESFQELCGRHKFLPPDKLKGLEVYTVPYTIGEKAYLQLHDYLTPFYEQEILSHKRIKERPKTRRFLRTAPAQPGLNILSYKAYLLFGSVKKLEDFTKKCQTQASNMHTCIPYLESITFPPDHQWDKIDFTAWGDAFIHHGYKEINPNFLSISHLIAPARNKAGKTSMLMTEFTLQAQQSTHLIGSHALQKIIYLSDKFKKSGAEFKRILDYSSRIPEPASVTFTKRLPALSIAGESFDLPGAIFRKLDSDDPRLFFLGDFTKCCEKVTDGDSSLNLEQTIAQAVTAQNNAYYVVERGDKILCHSWAWRGRDGEFVFDGFEAEYGKFTLHNLKLLLDTFGEEIRKEAHKQYGLNGVLLGQCASHLTFDKKYNSCYDAWDVMPKELQGIGMVQQTFKIILAPKETGSRRKEIFTPVV